MTKEAITKTLKAITKTDFLWIAGFVLSILLIFFMQDDNLSANSFKSLEQQNSTSSSSTITSQASPTTRSVLPILAFSILGIFGILGIQFWKKIFKWTQSGARVRVYPQVIDHTWNGQGQWKYDKTKNTLLLDESFLRAYFPKIQDKCVTIQEFTGLFSKTEAQRFERFLDNVSNADSAKLVTLEMDLPPELITDLVFVAASSIENKKDSQQFSGNFFENKKISASNISDTMNQSILLSFLNQNNIGVVILNNSFQVTNYNSAALNILELSENEITQKIPLDNWRVFKEDNSKFSEDELRFLLPIPTKNHKATIVGFKSKQGTDSWISLQHSKISEKENSNLGAILSFFDVTDLIKAKELLKKTSRQVLIEKNRNEKFIHGLNESMIVSVCDARRKIVFANPKFCEHTGFSIFEVIGQTHQDLFTDSQEPEFFEKLWQAIASGNPWRGEVSYRCKNGNLNWFESTVIPFLKNDKTIDQAMFIELDVTGIKVAEQSLVASSKLASLGEMAAGVAHEVNNPLAVILGFLEEIQDKLENSEGPVPSIDLELNKIKQTTLRISSIVKGLRIFSRSGEKDPFEKVSLRFLVTEALGLCKERFRTHGIDLECDALPDVTLHCRTTQIGQILFNLLSNSFDAIEHLAEKWVKISAQIEDGEKILIQLTDSGKGIPEPLISKIMQPFYTTKEIGKGTGLGLSISAGIAQSHNGKLYINTRHPNTQFVLELPIAQYQEQRNVVNQ